jgi:prepilin-type N-terminal cleavage/methylation domain-containing protein
MKKAMKKATEAMCSRTSANDHGFSIIEVLVALAIFTIGILGVAAMQLASVKGNTSGRGVTDITTWAADKIEDLISLPYSDPLLTAGTHSLATDLSFETDGIDNNFDGLIDETGENGPLTVSWFVTDDTPVNATKTISVTVNHSGPGVRKTVTINRVIPNII